MAWVITEPCQCKAYARCLEHCPVEGCILTGPGESQYYIDPTRCTDCGACDLACPVAAIFPEAAVPDHWQHFIERNRAAAARIRGGVTDGG
ncbi:MAG: 4Fe-4S binding protein [Bacillota bacterium]